LYNIGPGARGGIRTLDLRKVAKVKVRQSRLAVVAQWVEQLTHDPKFEGLNPGLTNTGRTKNNVFANIKYGKVRLGFIF
jgi:hypothetical protein